MPQDLRLFETAFRSGILFSAGRAADVFDTVPSIEIVDRRIGHVAQLGQPPMRSLALAVEAKIAGRGHDDETVVLQLTVGARSEKVADRSRTLQAKGFLTASPAATNFMSSALALGRARPIPCASTDRR